MQSAGLRQLRWEKKKGILYVRQKKTGSQREEDDGDKEEERWGKKNRQKAICNAPSVANKKGGRIFQETKKMNEVHHGKQNSK